MRVLILGFDALDPVVFERLSGRGELRHLTKYAAAGGYARFGVANPPQSEVSWTSIATGLNPGGHGIFDFVHRDPASYGLTVSLLPTKRSPGGTQFVPPHTARTVFDEAARQGFPATALWWPATFPARPGSPVRTLPGLGTPDIHGRLGVGTLFSTDSAVASETRKTETVVLRALGNGCYAGMLRGPIRKTRKRTDSSAVDLHLQLMSDSSARLAIGGQTVDLTEGVWSPVIELSFKMGRVLSVRALTRVILTRVKPDVRLYVLPLQLHPLRSPWRYGSPRGFVRQTWAACGPFLTIGWPQDTTALEEGCISDEQFLALCDRVFEARECVLAHHIDRFREGILAAVFDSLDRVQHMFWRDRPDIVEMWYGKLDSLLGRMEQRVGGTGRDQIKVVIVSDHGFADFNHKVHLNRWLLERGYLVARGDGDCGDLQEVDWSQTQAYAVGLNSLYLNLDGREGQGCVPAGQRDHLVHRLRDDLLRWTGPDGRAVIQSVVLQGEAFAGPFAQYGPDAVLGYAAGHRASSETGLGQWQATSLEPNHDHWGADHCMDPMVVPGVLFCNRDLKNFPYPSYRDFPALTIGAEPEQGDSGPRVPLADEDQATIEERLRGLGYL